MLKPRELGLGLILDPHMLPLYEKSIGSVISHRYVKANNSNVKSYDPNEHSSFIVHLDAKNL